MTASCVTAPSGAFAYVTVTLRGPDRPGLTTEGTGTCTKDTQPTSISGACSAAQMKVLLSDWRTGQGLETAVKTAQGSRGALGPLAVPSPCPPASGPRTSSGSQRPGLVWTEPGL